MLSRRLSISISKTIARGLAAFVIGSLLAVGAIEIGMRVTGYGAVSMLAYGRNHYHRDLPELGYAGRPNVLGIQSRESVSEVALNSHGFNDVEHSGLPAADTFRIVVLGNSYSMAEQVSRTEGYVWLLQSKMAQCEALAGRKVETINLAVDGYTIHQQYLLLRDYGLSLNPNLVLLQINDFTLPGDLDPNSNLSPRVELRPSGKINVDYSYMDTSQFKQRASNFAATIQQVSDYSRLVQYALEYRRVTAQQSTPKAGNNAENDKHEVRDPGVIERYRRGRDLVVGLMADLLRRRNIAFAITVIPTADSDSFSPLRRDPVKEDWTALAASHDIPFIDVEAEARAAVLSTGKYLRGFGARMGAGHLNRVGHAFFANALGARLCSHLAEQFGPRAKAQ